VTVPLVMLDKPAMTDKDVDFPALYGKRVGVN